MVDPQAPGMAHVGPHQIDEAGIGFVPQRQQVEGRQAPVLTGGIVQVGRRSDIGGAPITSLGLAQVSAPLLSAPTARSR